MGPLLVWTVVKVHLPLAGGFTEGLFTLTPKRPVHFYAKKKTVTCQNFSRISYIVTKIWQQTKCSYFFATLPIFGKVENSIKVNRP